MLQTTEDVSAAARGQGIDFNGLRAAAVAEGRAAELDSLAPQVLTLSLSDFEKELAQARAM